MKVIQGKQAVLRPYLSEEQCVTPVQGHLVVPEKPIAYDGKKISVKEPKPGITQEHFVRAAEAQAVTVHELSVEKAAVKELSTVPLHSVAAAIEKGRVMDVAKEDDLTIEQFFVQAMKE